MQYDFAGYWFTSFEEIENWLQTYIDSKDEMFFREGTRKLLERSENSYMALENILINMFIHFDLN